MPGSALNLAARQHGVIGWDQAHRAGITKSDARRLIRNGTWGHPHTGVYTVRDLIDRSNTDTYIRSVTMAAQLALGPHSFAGGETAARLWGVQGLPPWDGHTVHMVIPALGAQRHHHRITLHSWRTSPEEVTALHGIRLTDPVRTLRDTLLRVDRETAVCLMDSALQRGLILEEDIEGLELANRGRKGCVRVRSWWPLADGRAESPLETRVRLICVDGGMPPTDLQRRFLDGHGRTIGIADFWWEEQRLIGEADGLGPHSLPQALLRDRERQNALQRWHPDVRIVRFTWQDLKRPQYILASIARSEA
ncbi:type IV toxin-antitoxin system AbiEi family antitoxin domain-containing protein [Nocardiopsis lambiniae]|uniref:Type IV toxin-antitoxin system AbiEi family antitoxin domain-containing protein n=1 Tax=Nocardiopsis lambiniae TaxID=3075539 RepID=A0ABU2M4I6_9ACTN|nr:type IV toxin-antitoxin system AbiEi family antitoxin domain-containing protein [Nocardiopsis sp. DSM 44743]MDT0327544.1 type IV toxin-antitoxin system AbiEi family antitoxin domain-containing protein [Nocardiopsis sp. DSM 44743]